jgi:arylsulfatase A-like enzyme
LRSAFLAAAVGFGLGEAVLAGSAASAAGLGWIDVGASALGTAAVVLFCVLSVLGPIDRLLRTDGGRALGTGLFRALAAERSVALAWALGCGALGGAALSVLRLSPLWTASMSERFGLVATILASIAAALFAALLASALGNALGRRVALRDGWQRDLDRALAPLAIGAAVAAALWHLVEPRYAAAPLFAALCFAFGLLAGAPPRWIARAHWPLWAASLLALALLERLPAATRDVIAYRAPYASLAVGSMQALFDRDGDGAASVLLGGDCDDGDPRIHPKARDVPGNGIDENCNGGDAAAYAPPAPAFHPERGARHDVVILLIDALRPDRLSLAGYPRKTSPHLDAFAREATWFKNAYTTAPSTRFAMASLFTGRDVRRLRYRDAGGNDFVLLPNAPTLARQLKKAGYRTIGYTITYAFQHNRGSEQGFSSWATPWPIAEWRNVGRQKAQLTTEAVLGELRRARRDQPLFLFAHYDCTHGPYRKYDGFDFGDAPSDLYDSGLAHCDAQIGRVLDALRARPRWDETAVFVVSDHGELFGEHGLTSHGNSLFEPDVRVVLLARVPGAAARVVDAPVQLHWVAPTVLELAGERPSDKTDAASLLAAVRGERAPARRPLFMFTELQRGSVRYFASAVLDWPHKLIRDHRTRTLSLYDVAADPRERRSIVDADPRTAGRLSDLLEAYEAWAVP